jgi:hypothetical protein
MAEFSPARPPQVDYFDIYLARNYEVERLETALWDIFMGVDSAITPGQRLKCRACRELDALTADRLAKRMRRDGRISAPADPAGDEVAAVFTSLRKASWTDGMRRLRETLAESIPIGRDFRALFAQRDPDLAAFFVAHRLALRDFVEAELAGDTERSIGPVLALLERSDRGGMRPEGNLS